MKIFTITMILFLPAIINGQSLSTKLTVNNKDSTVLYLKIVKFSPLYRDFDIPLDLKAESNLDTTNNFELNLKITKPTSLSIMVLNKTQSIFVTPGDQITINITRLDNAIQFTFYGKNSAHYSYSGLSDEYMKSNNARLLFNKEQGIFDYKLHSDNWLKLKKKFLEEYSLSNNLSKDFIEYSKQEIEYEYVRQLYAPLNDKKVELKNIPINYFALADSIFKLKNKTIKYFTSNSMLAYTYRYITHKNENFKENFNSTFEDIKNNFKGETRSYLLTNLIGVYVKEQSDTYMSSLIKVINNAPKFISDTLLLSYISRRDIEYNKLNRFIPDAILTTTYLKKLNSDIKISLRDLLSEHKGKPLYIDFWASWCIPCREDNANSTLSKEFLKSKELNYIYISMDKGIHESRWEKASIDDHITTNQYILINNFESPLSNYLKIISIPRYIILSKDHKLKSIDAPRPTPSQLGMLKTTVLNAIK